MLGSPQRLKETIDHLVTDVQGVATRLRDLQRHFETWDKDFTVKMNDVRDFDSLEEGRNEHKGHRQTLVWELGRVISCLEIFRDTAPRLVVLAELLDDLRRLLNELLSIVGEVTGTGQSIRSSRDLLRRRAKLRLKGREDPAWGGDGVGYGTILEMENDAVLELCNCCIEKRDAPSAWVQTVLVTAKAAKARSTGFQIRNIMERRLDVIPPAIALYLYDMLVDPRLTHGCEVALCVNEEALWELAASNQP